MNQDDLKHEMEVELNEKAPLKGNTELVERKSCVQRCCFIFSNITVEPCMFLFVFPLIVCILTSQNLILEKTCRVSLNFSEEICDSLKLQTIEGENQYERDVQHIVTKTMAWRTYITASLPCLLSLFIGAWSDKTGHRKMFFMYTLTGQILVCINGVINTYFLRQLPLEVFVFSEAILDGLSGSWCVSFLTIYSYISAITTNENRTFRMGVISFCVTVGFPVGMGLSGILLRKLGYYGCYGVAGSLYMINLLYTTTILKDPQRSAEQKSVSTIEIIYN